MNSGDDRLVQLIGKRVSLRHRIAPESSAGPHLSDAVGELDDGGPGPDGAPTLRVRTRGGTVHVRVADVVAVRAVPPARPKRPSWAAVEHLERICADAWPAPVVRDLGAWRLRAAGGFTRRANSALAVGNPGVPVPDALAEVRRFADRHGIPPVVAAPEGSPWWRAVRDEGWEVGADPGAQAVVLVAGLDSLAADGPAPGIAFDAEPSPDWWSVFDEEGADLTARRAVLVPDRPDGPQLGFGTARRDDGALTGVVRAAVVGDHLYLSRLEVLPAARRSGVGSVLTAAAARWGAERGARYAVLQVVRSNRAARALYERLGCVEHHRYHYLVPG
ncbi:GNAT family N-acetyltransferase [Pseudonocardia endophytica]|uniref:Acetyltransferase (GNAT) family protein n=1 Tax=Pseudonocardia endophytica TaxID=401976 RepID=A0A4R1HZ90_PSEEN|nr:GNAT family N-acetyltransferase [Pseudonocardia endophytica]TCK26525.1 acetyltransferase (GNAT) family protein [Pseudonocardia endophytica]